MKKSIFYDVEGNSSNNQKYKEINPKLFYILIIKLVYKKQFERSIMKSSYCSLCNKILSDKLIHCHVSSKDIFANVIELKRKIFSVSFVIFLLITYVHENIMKTAEFSYEFPIDFL